MHFHVLNADFIPAPPVGGVPLLKPANIFQWPIDFPAIGVPIPPPPPPGLGPAPGAFACIPIAVMPPAVALAPITSSIAGATYQPLLVNAAAMLWDSITVGYGKLAEVALLTGGNVLACRRVRQFAASRARMLRTIYDWPAGPLPGPRLRPEYEFVESSERVMVSFLIGQTVAQTLAKNSWNAPRLFHRSLYGPILPAFNPGLIPLPPGQSPDYLCFIPPAGAPAGLPLFGLVEAKGTNSIFNPQTNKAHLAKLHQGFLQANAILGAQRRAVTMACFDAGTPLPPDTIVGQFWDPPDPDAFPVSVEAAALLTAEYFRRLLALLDCFSVPDRDVQRRMMVWNAVSVGFRIRMDYDQWRLIRSLSQGVMLDLDFFNEISAILARIGNTRGDDRPNGDGLYLEIIEFD